MSSPYAPIPEIANDTTALYEAVKALKATIDILTGNGVGSTNQTFVQRDTPTATKTGDGWVRPAVLAGETVQISAWDGQRWLKIV